MKLILGMLGFAVVLAAAGPASAKCDDPAALAAARAEVAAQCPCDGFDNHGQYVRCARGVAKDLANAGLLPRNCKGEVARCAARSTCGKPGFVTCCRTDKRGKTRCSTKKDATKCTAPKGGEACVGLFPSCCDACDENGCVGATPTPAPTATPTPEPTATPTPVPTETPPPYGSASEAFVDGTPSLLQ